MATRSPCLISFWFRKKFAKRLIEQVIIFLALSKIGAVYIPIAPANTAYSEDNGESESARVNIVLGDCKPKLIIGNSFAIESFSNEIDKCCIDDFEQLGSLTKSESSHNPDIDVSKDDDAYIIYSSGTTGKPKGIPIRHSGLIKWGKFQENYFNDLNEKSRVIGFISIGFDAHIWEYLLAFVKKSELRIISYEASSSPCELLKFLIESKITHATLIPTVLRSLDLQKNIKALKKSGLTTIYSTGESCTYDIVTALHSEKINLYNCYGPTELTFGLSVKKITEIPNKDGDVPIGNPAFDDVRVYILEETSENKFREVDRGELFVDSPYSLSNYVNKEDNQDRILEISIRGELKRLFRTRDRVYRLGSEEQGYEYYYEGRVDLSSHVKISGQFIELSGIESLLRNYESSDKRIKDACVLVKNHPETKEPRLIAFCASEGEISPEELRNYLSSKVSKISIPAHFIFLENLPATKNGKIDKKALECKKIAVETFSKKALNKPENPLEEKLVKIWQETLGYGNISIDVKQTSYLSLGGNSSNVVILRSKILSSFELDDIPQKEFFPMDRLTIKKLADIVYENQKINDDDLNVLISKENFSENSAIDLFLIPDIMGNGVVYQNLLKSFEGVNCYALNSISLYREIYSSSVESIAKFYIKVMSRKAPNVKRYAIAGWSFGCEVAWEIARQLEKSGKQVVFLFLIDGISPSLKKELPFNYYANQLEILINKIENTFFNSAKDFFEHPSSDFEKFSKLDLEEQVKRVFSRKEELAGSNKNLVKLIYSNLIAALGYTPKKLTSVKPLVISCAETQSQLSKFYVLPRKSLTLGWSMTGTACLISSSEIEGDHFSILESSLLSSEIRDELKTLLSSLDHHDSKLEEVIVAQQQQQQETLLLLRNISSMVFTLLAFQDEHKSGQPHDSIKITPALQSLVSSGLFSSNADSKFSQISQGINTEIWQNKN